jgi:hypothetical protein
MATQIQTLRRQNFFFRMTVLDLKLAEVVVSPNDQQRGNTKQTTKQTNKQANEEQTYKQKQTLQTNKRPL